jgi:nucleotide-binding universal stress UspA family protein
MNEGAPARRIVVGIDGSEHSTDALRWAVAHAGPDDVVEAAIVWEYPPHGSGVGTSGPTRSDVAAHARQVLDTAIDRVEKETPNHPRFLRQVVAGVPGPTLATLADGADMLVVGSRGLGAIRGFLLGSVSQHCTTHAMSPVVVVPARPHAEVLSA